MKKEIIEKFIRIMRNQDTIERTLWDALGIHQVSGTDKGILGTTENTSELCLEAIVRIIDPEGKIAEETIEQIVINNYDRSDDIENIVNDIVDQCQIYL